MQAAQLIIEALTLAVELLAALRAGSADTPLAAGRTDTPDGIPPTGKDTCMTSPGKIIPTPMAAAAARPRDSAGRVTLPIRAEVKFLGGSGYRKHFDGWEEVQAFLGSDDFTRTAAAVRSVTIVRPYPYPEPGEPRTAGPRSLAALIRNATTEAA